MTTASSYLRGRLAYFSVAELTEVEETVADTYRHAMVGGTRNANVLRYNSQGVLREANIPVPSVTVCALFMHALRLHKRKYPHRMEQCGFLGE